jgi:hypothetical protein
MLGELTSTSNNLPSTGIDEKSTDCSTSTSCLVFSSFSIVFLSTCFSSSKSLITTNINARGENCLQRPHNVFPSPFPIVVTCFNASKISCFTFFSSPKLSLLSQNIGGNLDASRSM